MSKAELQTKYYKKRKQMWVPLSTRKTPEHKASAETEPNQYKNGCTVVGI